MFACVREREFVCVCMCEGERVCVCLHVSGRESLCVFAYAPFGVVKLAG